MSFKTIFLFLQLTVVFSCGVKNYPVPSDKRPFPSYDQKFNPTPQDSPEEGQ